MIKNALDIYSIMLLAIGLLNIVSISVYCINNEIAAVAQTSNSQGTVTMDHNSTKENATILKSSYDTFSAVGAISSLNFYNNSALLHDS